MTPKQVDDMYATGLFITIIAVVLWGVGKLMYVLHFQMLHGNYFFLHLINGLILVFLIIVGVVLLFA